MSKAQASTAIITTHSAESRLPPLDRELRHGLARAFRTLLAWQNRVSQRGHLSELEGRLLADMGISPGDAAQEARKPFWQA